MLFHCDLIERAVREQLCKENGETIYINELDQIEYLHIWGNNFYNDNRQLLLSCDPEFDKVYLHFDEYSESGEIQLTRGDIKNLDDLLMFKNIKSLHLVLQNIDDISLISSLPLEELNIAGNNITNLSPLENCIGIVSLNLDGNPLSDISPVSKLAYLRGLSASDTVICDLTPLSKLYKLKFLYINNAYVDDVTPLANLDLVNLYLQNNKINDFSSLPPIENLNIDGNP